MKTPSENDSFKGLILGPRPLMEVAEIILREKGPLTMPELVVAIKAAGCRPEADPRRLLGALRQSVRRYPARFTAGDDGRWSAG
jgi:hypothetical protein